MNTPFPLRVKYDGMSNMKPERCFVKREVCVMEASQPSQPSQTVPKTFGEFIVSFYDEWSEPDAGKMVRLALDAGLVVLQSADGATACRRTPNELTEQFTFPKQFCRASTSAGPRVSRR